MLVSLILHCFASKRSRVALAPCSHPQESRQSESGAEATRLPKNAKHFMFRSASSQSAFELPFIMTKPAQSNLYDRMHPCGALHRYIRDVLCVWLVVLAVLPAVHADAPKTRILFIGNSYTGQIRQTVTELFNASPQADRIELSFFTPGGKTLEFHLNNPDVIKNISDGGWDYVVLQDQSQTPALFPGKFASAASGLDALIDAAGAQTVFYQTWGRRDGDKANLERFPDYLSMQTELSKSYAREAKRCDALLAAVGDTWAAVRQADATLGVELYKKDGSHPSKQGAYLAACVFYVTLFEQSPAKIDYRGGVTEQEAQMIWSSLVITQQ